MPEAGIRKKREETPVLTKCPVTGLDVLERPQWNYDDPEANYHLKIRVIGGRILHARVSGRVTLPPLRHAIERVRRAADEIFGIDAPYVQIEDYRGLHGSTIESRRYFIDDITSRPNIAGLICCNASAFFRVNIRLAMKLTKYHFRVQVTETFPEALALALGILSPEASTAGPAERIDHCPVSGLPVRRYPEWTNIELGSSCRATFEVLGDHLLLSRCHGKPESERRLQGAYFDARRRVLDRALSPGAAFFEIRDFTYHKGGFSPVAWRRFVAAAQAAGRPWAGFAGFHMPTRLRLEIAAWQRLQRPTVPFRLEKDYRTALTRALRAVAHHYRAHDKAPLEAIRRPEWNVSSGGFAMQTEIIDKRILHLKMAGSVSLADVEPMQKRILEAAATVLSAAPHDSYVIVGLQELRTASGSARRRIFDILQKWAKAQPAFKMLLFYGANAVFRAAINLSRPFIALNIRMLGDLSQALAAIETDRYAATAETGARAPVRGGVERTGGEDTHRHIEEMLAFLGGINWETDGPVHPPNSVGRGHPLEQVYEAIALIKMDLDDLLRERKRSEEERLRLATTLEQSTEGILITDTQGRVQYVNPAFERLSGYGRDEVLALPLSRILEDPDPNGGFQEMWNRVESGAVWRRRMACRRKDGVLYHADVTVSPVFGEGGNIISYAVDQRDITHELKLEAQLHQRLKMEAIGTLAGGIAHDFNNVLYPIIGFAEMTLDDLAEGSVAAENQREILKAAGRAKDLVDQILTFSRQEEPRKEPVAVQNVLTEAIRLLRASLPATIEIRHRFHDEPMTILADPTHLHQVVLNLGTNAGHAIGRGNGSIVFSLEPKAFSSEEMSGSRRLPPGKYAWLQVKDTGCGMAPEIHDRIFDPFFTTKAPGEGTGMGLSLVHGIVTGHGGHIAIDSAPGRGTCVDIHLPLIANSGQTLPEAPVEITAAANVRVLLVDDEVQIIRMTTQMLKQMGCRVTAFTASRDALEAFGAHPDRFDVVLTDLTMPAMTGEALARAVREIRPDIPVIICSGFMNIRADEHLAGFCQYLTKPLFRSDLNRAIGRAMENRPQQASQPETGAGS